MNYFAFTLKCKKLYTKINDASKLSYKSSNTRSPFFRSVTGGAHTKVTWWGGGSSSSCLKVGIAIFCLT